MDNRLISDRDQVDEATAEYLQEVYGSEDQDQQMETEEDLTMCSRFEAAAEATQDMFTTQDVVEAMKAFNFIKRLGPDWFDGTIL